MREYFLNIVHSLGIQTRIIECNLEFEYQHINSKESFSKEYEMLGQSGNDTINQALRIISKEKDTTNVLILELLMQLYQKISKIDRMLLQDKQTFLPLDKQGVINALGHGIICSKDGHFIKGGLYYLRFYLPNISQRMLGVFGEALDTQVMKLTSIHSYDVDALDNYIAMKEMEYLRQKRTQND